MLTFTESDQQKEEMLAAAEKLSLQRLRDSMGPGLEPLVGLLRYATYFTTRIFVILAPVYSNVCYGWRTLNTQNYYLQPPHYHILLYPIY